MRGKEALRVLLVDDDSEQRELLAKHLKSQLSGCTLSIFEAANPEQAKVILTEKPDLAFLDYLYRGHDMNGIELATELWRKQPSLGICIQSSSAGRAYVRHLFQSNEKSAASESSSFAYVCKSISNMNADLQAAINALTDGDCWWATEYNWFYDFFEKKDPELSDNEFAVLVFSVLGLENNLSRELLMLSKRAFARNLEKINCRFSAAGKTLLPAELIYQAKLAGTLNDQDIENWRQIFEEYAENNEIEIEIER